MSSFPSRHRLTLRRACVPLLLFPLFWNCRAQTPREEGTVIARVGNAVLTLETLEASIPEQMIQQISAEEKREVAERWVEKQLLYQEALRRGIEQNPLIKKWVEQAKVDLIVNALLKRELGEGSDFTEAEITQYYDGHKEEFVLEQDEIWGRYLQIRTYRRAQAIHRRLSAGTSFEEAVTEGDSMEVSSGDLGYFSQGDIDDKLWEAISNVREGAFTPPVKTRFGYHILQVLDRRKAGDVRELDEVREQIMDLLLFERQRERVDQLLQRLRSETPCEIHSELLSNHVEP